MFTGIVEARAEVLSFERRGEGARLVVRRPDSSYDAGLGDSISVSGCCLTRVEPLDDELHFDLSGETMERTWFAALAPGRHVNLERALRMGDRLGGHLVSGHVDGGGTVLSIDGDRDSGWTVRFEVDAGLERYLIEKGSVTLDGVSLTVVEPEGRTFSVAVIPQTFDETTIGLAEPGQRVNVEVDLVGKWIEKLIPG